MPKREIKTIDEIRAEMKEELQVIFGTGSTYGHSDIAHIVSRYTDKVVERALHKFNQSIEDKQRQLKLGELADQFFQAVKLGEQNHGRN